MKHLRDMTMSVSFYECGACSNVNLIQSFLNCPEYCGRCGAHKSETKESARINAEKEAHGCVGHPCKVCGG